MAPGREGAGGAYAAVVIRGSLHDDRILVSTELLSQHRVHIVTPSSEFVGEIVREALVGRADAVTGQRRIVSGPRAC